MLTVGSGGCAAIGIVTELMDMHATLSIGVVASDVPCDRGRRGFGLLLKGDRPGDLRVTSHGCNYHRQSTWLARVWRRSWEATQSQHNVC